MGFKGAEPQSPGPREGRKANRPAGGPEKGRPAVFRPRPRPGPPATRTSPTPRPVWSTWPGGASGPPPPPATPPARRRAPRGAVPSAPDPLPPPPRGPVPVPRPPPGTVWPPPAGRHTLSPAEEDRLLVLLEVDCCVKGYSQASATKKGTGGPVV